MNPDEVVVVETSVWIDYFADRITDQTAWLEQHTHVSLIVVLDLILCEVLQGIRDDRLYEPTLETLNTFIVLGTGGESLARQSADHYRSLRKRGITTRSTIDCLIATFCIRQGYSLLHNDRDFDPFEEHLSLKVIHPPSLPVH